MPEKYDFVIFGNCATVQVLKFDKMPEICETVTASNPFADEIYYGGCSFNVFYAMAKLGINIYPALTYADPRFEQKIFDICREYGLPTDGIEGPRNKCYTTCLMLQDEDRCHITMMYHFGEDSDKTCISERYLHDIKPEYFENSETVIMVMSSPSVGYKIMEQVRAHGNPLVFSYRNDPVLLPKELLDEILPETTVLLCNETEAEYLAELYSMEHITDWFERGRAEVIVVTQGKKGSIVYTQNESGNVAGIPVPVTENEVGNIDAIGAGDSFVAGFLYGMVNEKSYETCAQYGSTVSSFVIEKDGSTTNLPTAEQLLERNNKRPDARNN